MLALLEGAGELFGGEILAAEARWRVADPRYLLQRYQAEARATLAQATELVREYANAEVMLKFREIVAEEIEREAPDVRNRILARLGRIYLHPELRAVGADAGSGSLNGGAAVGELT